MHNRIYIICAGIALALCAVIIIGIVLVSMTTSKADTKNYTKVSKCIEMTEENRPLLVGPDYLPKITEGVCNA